MALRRVGAEAVRLRALPDEGPTSSPRPGRPRSRRVTVTTLNLHPEALAYLRLSGLSDATIVETGLYTPTPGDLPRLLGPRLVDMLVVP